MQLYALLGFLCFRRLTLRKQQKLDHMIHLVPARSFGLVTGYYWKQLRCTLARRSNTDDGSFTVI